MQNPQSDVNGQGENATRQVGSQTVNPKSPDSDAPMSEGTASREASRNKR